MKIDWGAIIFAITMSLILIPLLVLSVILDTPTDISNPEPPHECITFEKYNKHYQITPMTWGYKDALKCVECGKDWK